jgi:hypothetical protein
LPTKPAQFLGVGIGKCLVLHPFSARDRPIEVITGLWLLFFIYAECTAHIQLLYFWGEKAYIVRSWHTEMEEPMTEMPIDWAPQAIPPGTKSPAARVPAGLRVAGSVLRTIFILSLLVVIVRVSMPQSETIWTVYETPADLVRVTLGFAVCVWIAVQLFVVPKDAQAYRTWVYLGLV